MVDGMDELMKLIKEQKDEYNRANGSKLLLSVFRATQLGMKRKLDQMHEKMFPDGES